MKYHHIPVMLDQAIEALKVVPGGRYIDCTVGEGGHSQAILERSMPGGQLLGFDADPQAIQAARSKLYRFGKSVLLINDNFVNLKAVCLQYNFRPVHGILFDLGMSSAQLDKAEGGFSFQKEAPLDMRFSPDQKLSAAEIVNDYSENDLAMIIWKYGEEPKSRRIARDIVRNRPLKTTLELARVIAKAVNVERKKIHPATRVFQALRIAVNQEIENVTAALEQAVEILGINGRLVVISFHSLEDRAVKEFFKLESTECICPPQTPECSCDHIPRLRIINKKVMKPSSTEITSNPRSRSARMRIAEKINLN